jgi:hypothetical protein
MSELKTRPTGQRVAVFLNSVEPPQKREDCYKLVEIMERLTNSRATMWGASIVGFGTYTYVGTNKKPADWPITGFSPRKANITIYIMPGFEEYTALMARLGKHTTGKSCLYIKKLADIELSVLEDLITRSVALMRERYSTT